jgi:glutathione peroxidase
MKDSVYSLTATSLAGDPVELASYQGKLTLFVNVASECGYTPQYTGLQALYEELGGEDFAIVGIPSNDFGAQEPGSAQEIEAFCQENYGVTFAMLEKVGTKEGDSPLFDRLAELSGERPGWNFCKYLVSRDGTEARFFKSGVTPEGPELRAAIDAMRAN